MIDVTLTPTQIRATAEVRNAIKRYTEKCRETKPDCWICNKPIDYDLDFDPANRGYFQVDHLIPISIAPEMAANESNFGPSHAICNQDRGDSASPNKLGRISRNWEKMCDW